MRPIETLKQEKGFSLIEVLAALGLLTVISLTFASLLKSQHEQAAYADDRISYAALKRDLGALFEQNDQNCAATLQGKKVDDRKPEKKIAIKDEEGQTLIDPSHKKLNQVDDLIISDIQMSDIDVKKGGGSGEVLLKVFVERRRKGSASQNLRPIELTQSVMVDDKNKVVSCTGAGGVDLTLTCVERDYKRYKPDPPLEKQNIHRQTIRGNGPERTNVQTGSLKVDRDVTAISFDVSALDYTHTRCGSRTSNADEKEIHCFIPETKLVIYPGESKKPNGKLYAQGGRFEIKHGEVYTVEHETCGSDNAHDNDYQKTDIFYDGQLLATYDPNAAPRYRGAGCPKLIVHDTRLIANQLPSQCAVKNKPFSGGSPPYNLGLKFYKLPVAEGNN